MLGWVFPHLSPTSSPRLILAEREGGGGESFLLQSPARFAKPSSSLLLLLLLLLCFLCPPQQGWPGRGEGGKRWEREVAPSSPQPPLPSVCFFCRCVNFNSAQ